MSGGVRGAMERGWWRRDLLDELHLEHALGAHEEEEERAEEEGPKDDEGLHIPRGSGSHAARAPHSTLAQGSASRLLQRCRKRAQCKQRHMAHGTGVPTQP